MAGGMDNEALRGPSISLFDGLADHVVQELLRQAQTRRLAAESLLFGEGLSARAVHVLMTGFVKLVQTTPSGEHVITRYIKPGETFGTPALLGDVYPADAIAVTTCIEMQWPSAIIRDLMARYPNVALNALREHETRLREMESRLRDLSSGTVEQRIAHALSRLAHKFGQLVSDGLEIPFPLSRQNLADLAGTTLHTVSRTLGSWEAQGQIRRGRRRVVVTDITGLALLATQGPSSEFRHRRMHRRAGKRLP